VSRFTIPAAKGVALGGGSGHRALLHHKHISRLREETAGEMSKVRRVFIRAFTTLYLQTIFMIMIPRQPAFSPNPYLGRPNYGGNKRARSLIIPLDIRDSFLLREKISQSPSSQQGLAYDRPRRDKSRKVAPRVRKRHRRRIEVARRNRKDLLSSRILGGSS